MTMFNPCQGKSACRDDGTRCLTCGRDLQEIERLRVLLDQLATLAMDYDYENVQAYAGYISRKLQKTIQYRRDATQESCLT